MKVLISPSLIEEARLEFPEIEWVAWDYFTEDGWLIC